MEWKETSLEDAGKVIDQMCHMSNSNRIAYEQLEEKYNLLLDAVITSGNFGAEGYQHEKLLELATRLKKEGNNEQTSSV